TIDVASDWTDVVLPFAVERSRPLEFRAAWDGKGAAAIDWVLVVAADRPDPEWSYEVEALPHRLGERSDLLASGGWAGYADPGERRHTALVSGPARLFPAARSRLSLRLRAATPGRGPLVGLAVTEPMGAVLATRTIPATEVPVDTFGEVTLDFDLSRAAVLEFPVLYLGDVSVFFDRITVTPR